MSGLPKTSPNTVRVRMLDTTAVMAVRAEAFVKPVLKGHEIMNMTAVCFLIENERLGKRAVFDLGVRKDFWNSPPAVIQRLKAAIPGVKVEKDVTEILEAGGVSLDSIDDIIWSHSHWDHVGSTFLFPKSTNLVYGEETGPFPGYPDSPDSPLLASNFVGRRCIPIAFDSGLQIGGFPAHDFYADGSVYLLDAPGHLPGHMCALVRTTPDSFVFLGGDICHFPGDFRPSETIPFPDQIPENAFKLAKNRTDRLVTYPMPCPCSIFAEHHPQGLIGQEAASTPFYKLSTHHHSSYRQPETATRTMETMQRAFDADPAVLVCLAHDPALLAHLPTFNETPELDLNNWQEIGMKANCHWGWLSELPRYDAKSHDPQMEERPIVEGFWRNNAKIDLPDGI